MKNLITIDDLLTLLEEDDCTLSTTDNPWNPITEYDAWDGYDRNVLKYNTNCYLARIIDSKNEDFPYSADELCVAHALWEILYFDLLALSTEGRVHYVLVNSKGEQARPLGAGYASGL